jgi:hypothetical protein
MAAGSKMLSQLAEQPGAYYIIRMEIVIKNYYSH